MVVSAAGPDAHAVPLGAVLARRDLALTRVVDAGDPGIVWAVVSELAEPARYLRGGEFVLTAGLNLPRSAEGVRDYVRSLAEARVSAVGFGVTPVHDTIPAALVEECRSQRLPLVEVPRPTPFAAVSQAVGEELEDRRLRDLRRMGEAHQRLTRAVTAARPVDRVLDVLAESLGAWSALAAPEGLRAGPGAPDTLDGELTVLVAKLTEVGGPRSAKAVAGPDEVFLHTVGTPPDDHGVVLVGRPRPLGVTDRAVLRTATALLDLLPRRHDDAPPVPGRLLTALLVDGALTGPAAPLLAELTGAGGTGAPAYRVLRAVPAGAARHTSPAELPLPTQVLDTGTGPEPGLRAVLADRGEDEHRAQLDELRAHGWIAALSGPAAPEDLPGADRGAAALLERARAVGRPLVREEDDDPFAGLLTPAGADDLARGILGPLAEETDAARTLRRTLRAWLVRHGNWDRTAADLGAHRNSVRYRIGRIERDLDVDLADAEQRMRLWFALTRWRSGG
ncbi:PucR family transcriptional regulator [Nocardiopsis sp. CNR-923]|uniref:PucR family transcriptional regulator n=1 Tax=Nocardiopsis sp. CNR-923 TaxID=1904965 RepID=UPI0009680A3B|nr:PucR family transcriptional regulator [Nocardiopsis sp. CNR-923]OLT30672.1 PucR family transcriptional regulator [Nocardiopsis sp. CNR-923]